MTAYLLQSLFQVLGLQILLPLFLLFWLFLPSHQNRLVWALKSLVVFCLLVAIDTYTVWLIVPWYVADIYLVTAVLISAYSGWQLRHAPWMPLRQKRRTFFYIGGLSAASFVSMALVGYLLSGWIPQAGPSINLKFPLNQGTYYAVNAGSNLSLNPHLKTLAAKARFVPWRGQSYGIDLVKVNKEGLRASGILPPDPSDYAIYGDKVSAPCTGKVVQASDGRPDMTVPLTDPDHSKLAGNHVLLNCHGTEVLLAHLQQGSVAVNKGDQIQTGDYLGRVGNSGNSTEPHLHISAQRKTPGQPMIGGEPVAILFDDNYLVRNERIARD